MKKTVSLPIAFILISVVISQSGCLKSSTADQYPAATATADTIKGIVQFKQTDINGTSLVSWKFGEANISAVSGGTNVFATSKVQADGSFELILPATIPGAYFSNFSDIVYTQGGTLKVTPETVRLFGSTQFKVDYTYNGKARSMIISLATLKTDFTVNRTYYFNFYDSNGTFSGKSTSGNVFNWTFTKGWGLVESYLTNISSGLFNSKSVSAAPENAVWTNN